MFYIAIFTAVKKPYKIFGFIKGQSTQAYFYIKKKKYNLVGRLFCWYLMSPGDSSSEKITATALFSSNFGYCYTSAAYNTQ